MILNTVTNCVVKEISLQYYVSKHMSHICAKSCSSLALKTRVCLICSRHFMDARPRVCCEMYHDDASRNWIGNRALYIINRCYSRTGSFFHVNAFCIKWHPSMILNRASLSEYQHSRVSPKALCTLSQSVLFHLNATASKGTEAGPSVVQFCRHPMSILQ